MILIGVLGLGPAPAPARQRAEVGAVAVTATVSLVIFGLFGHVHWDVVAVAAPASLLGGFLGARIATRIPATPLRILIVTFGVAVSIYLSSAPDRGWTCWRWASPRSSWSRR